MSSKKTTLTLKSGVGVPAGTVMLLTREQAVARRHLLTPVKDWYDDDAKPDARLGFTNVHSTFFKAGEEIGFEGAVDRTVQAAAGIEGPQGTEAPKVIVPKTAKKPAQSAIDAALERGRKAGRTEALAEVEAFNRAADAVADAEEALETAKAGGDAEVVKSAEEALAAAKNALPAEPQP